MISREFDQGWDVMVPDEDAYLSLIDRTVSNHRNPILDFSDKPVNVCHDSESGLFGPYPAFEECALWTKLPFFELSVSKEFNESFTVREGGDSLDRLKREGVEELEKNCGAAYTNSMILCGARKVWRIWRFRNLVESCGTMTCIKYIIKSQLVMVGVE